MDTNQTEKLKALALAATQGEWQKVDRTVYVLEPAGWRKGVEQFRNRFSCTMSHDGSGIPQQELNANAAFVAASCPAAVLELIAEVERLRAEVETRDALLRALNAVAIERGDKYGACDCIDNDGAPYQSKHLDNVLVSGAPATGAKGKA